MNIYAFRLITFSPTHTSKQVGEAIVRGTGISDVARTDLTDISKNHSHIYYMYNIIQLNDKNLSELQAIAQELGIKKTDSLKKEELVYKILDEQAIAGATKKVAADKLKEERKGDKQKRSRVTVKKEAADKVFTAKRTVNSQKGKPKKHLPYKPPYKQQRRLKSRP